MDSVYGDSIVEMIFKFVGYFGGYLMIMYGK